MFKIHSWLRIALILLFGIYLTVVAFLCFTPRLPLTVQLGSYPELSSIMVGRAEVVYMPFQELFTEGFWLNVVMTMPMGGFIYLLVSRIDSLKRILIVGLLTGLTIETGAVYFR